MSCVNDLWTYALTSQFNVEFYSYQPSWPILSPFYFSGIQPDRLFAENKNFPTTGVMYSSCSVCIVVHLSDLTTRNLVMIRPSLLIGRGTRVPKIFTLLSLGLSLVLFFWYRWLHATGLVLSWLIENVEKHQSSLARCFTIYQLKWQCRISLCCPAPVLLCISLTLQSRLWVMNDDDC